MHEPGLEICDAHHHVFAAPEWGYDLATFAEDARRAGVTRSVFVECGQAYREGGRADLRPVGETEWIGELAASAGGLVDGIVAFADLSAGRAVGEVLDAHTAAGRGRLRGIRQRAAWDASPLVSAAAMPPDDPHLLAQPGFRRGLAEVGARGLVFDAWVFFHQLPELLDAAKGVPDVTVVVDHLGGLLGVGPYSGRFDESLEVWRSSLRELAACENVCVKLGGIGMRMYGNAWHERAEPPGPEEVAAFWGPHVRWCIETFGADRCMFESNYPVDRALPYETIWGAFALMTGDLGAHERRALFSGTATRLYRLP